MTKQRDIVERLREVDLLWDEAYNTYGCPAGCTEAADEIERLRAEVEMWKDEATRNCGSR